MAHQKRTSSSPRRRGLLALALTALLSPSGLFLAGAAGIATVGGGVMLNAVLDERPHGTPLRSPTPNTQVAAAPEAANLDLEHEGRPVSLVLGDASEPGTYEPGGMLSLRGTPAGDTPGTDNPVSRRAPPGGAGTPHGLPIPGTGSAPPAAPFHTAGLPASPGTGSPTGSSMPGGGHSPDGNGVPGGRNPTSGAPGNHGTPPPSGLATPKAGAPHAPPSNKPSNTLPDHSGTPPANPAPEGNSSLPGQTNPLADAPLTDFPLAYVPGKNAPPGGPEDSLPLALVPSAPEPKQSAPATVSEPSTVGLMLLGLAGLAWAGRRRS